MRIGTSDNFLSLQNSSLGKRPQGWRFEAAVSGPGWNFTAVGEMPWVDTSPETIEAVLDFADLKVHRIQLMLPEGGWLRIKRDVEGRVLVRYRVNRLKVGAAMEGEIVLDAASAIPLYGELRALL